MVRYYLCFNGLVVSESCSESLFFLYECWASGSTIDRYVQAQEGVDVMLVYIENVLDLWGSCHAI